MVFTLVNLYYCEMPIHLYDLYAKLRAEAHPMIYTSVKYALSKFVPQPFLLYFKLATNHPATVQILRESSVVYLYIKFHEL